MREKGKSWVTPRFSDNATGMLRWDDWGEIEFGEENRDYCLISNLKHFLDIQM